VSVSFNVPGFTQRRLVAVLGALMLAVLLASLETSIIATALPTITGEFNGFESYAWVGTAYIVTSAIGTPVLGKLSDLHGRRRIFQITMVIFLCGSILCGASQSMGQLIAARGVQGLGGGGIQALAFAIIGDVIPPRERGRYVGYFTLAFVGSALLGPLLGGLIIEQWTWPWIFYLNVPFAIVVMVVCHFALRLPFRRVKARLDYAGVALLSVAIGSLMIGLEEGREGWTDPLVLGLFAIAAVTLVLFVVVERHVAEPLIPPRLFRDKVIVSCLLLGLCAGVVTYGAAQFLPLYFQDSLFVSPTESGLRMLPQMIGVTMATFGVGRLIATTGRYKPFPIIGSLASLIGLLGVAQITGGTEYITLIVPMILMGFGAASVFTTTSIASQNAAEMRDLGVVTATIMFFRSLGGSFGLAAFGTTLNATIRSEIPARTGVPPDEASDLIRSPEEIAALPSATRAAVVDGVALGVSRIYLICAGAMACALVVAIFMPERPLRLRAGLSDAMEERTANAAGTAPVAPVPATD
jgi:EmrB/QacA subfamily drug resistance transporter